MANPDPENATVTAASKAKGGKAALIEIKNGKPMLKQKPMSFEKMSDTLQEIVQFRGMLEQRINEHLPPLDSISDQHLPLIAKLVQESDRTTAALAKSIQQELLPVQDEEAATEGAAAPFTLQAVEKAIKHVATRTNYGLEASTAGGKVPAAWNIWRWEVKNEFRHWLPKSAKDKADSRAAERRQAKADLKTLFQEMSEEERSRIVGSKTIGSHPGKNKPPAKQEAISVSVTSQETIRDSDVPSNTNTELDGPSDGASASKGKSAKPSDPEKEAKERERAERKAAKIEKEKKEKAAQEKSRSLFASFFGKAKNTVTAKTSRDDSSAPVAGPSRVQSEYERVFKPFILKKDAELALVNWFLSGKRSTSISQAHANGKEIIIIDDDERQNDEDIIMADAISSDVGTLSTQERLTESIAKLAKIGPVPPRRRLLHGLRTSHPYIVRSVINQLNEAEIAGDDQLVRSLLSLLRSRKDIPAKILIFHEDARPGYFGTWTRPSHEVGPRTPFSKDVVARDYSYDSGEEWEEEEGGEDVVEDADEEETAADDEADSDLDSWLVDDDEVEDPGTPVEEREGSMDPLDLPPPLKRKSGDGENKSGKRRKVVVPLVPFSKGPCWENTVGQCEQLFNSYRIQLFNDTPFPIDPFTFVSASVENPSVDDGFAVPAVPNHVAALQGTPVSTSNLTSKRSLAPKTTFPSEHLPLLISKISAMETGNITAIVEVIYQELRTYKVKKNAIEAKVREIGEKDKKVWVVKPDIKAAVGLA